MNIRARGMTLIDVLVGSALIVIVFLALMGVLRASLLVSDLAKARAAASSLADSQMEYLRGLSYDALGMEGGIPAGVVPQSATTTIDGATYNVRTFIQYIDDPADGLGASDENGITTDYKLAKVTVSYTAGGKPRTVTLLSNFAPPGIETTTGGGTLVVRVVNASGAPVSGATVRIVNSTVTPSVDESPFTNASGEVNLPGAATSTQYQIYVRKDGYSSAQTYARDTTNQNPTPGYLTIAKDQTTTGTFAIDTLTSLVMHTFSPPAQGSFTDTFADESKLATTSNLHAVGGGLEISGGALSGSATSTPISPSHLSAWGNLTASLSVASGSGARVYVYDGAGALLPESVLPGNSAGFATFPVSLASVSTSTYPALALDVVATTSDPAIVPELLDWSLGYTTGPTPLPNAPFTLTGSKTIGSTGSGAPIYKTVVATTTNASGVRALTLEWDTYTLSASGYDVQDACIAPPYTLAPGASPSASLTLGSATTNRLFVTVTDIGGQVTPGATVTLSRTGYTHTTSSSGCGGAYFGNLSAASDYTVTIAKSGYTTTTFSNVGVSGQTFYAAVFP
ncbi:MAG TPA: carboxypeptidase-like regulatory domain-containing protein [Candidatus Paceibacterota bacterium]